ncbi:hypothetical protein [Paraclostridium bifermentans]|uniref:hypothetical protein n=1 Tax=Paraclostridium bifermentans TaxID=1490 RepID=UPI0025B08F7B|nr:hypothetical protein [Paraclostridium bifermentans]
MELEYFEDIKADFIDTYIHHIESDGLNPCVHWFLHESDVYMTDKYPAENACHYLAIGAYLIFKKRINELDKGILEKIKKSYEDIKNGKYNNLFTNEDKKYISEDIDLIEKSNLLE